MRVPPVPVKKTFVPETTDSFDDVAESVMLLSGVSTSVSVTVMFVLIPPAGIVVELALSAIVGASLIFVTLSVKFAVVNPNESATLTVIGTPTDAAWLATGVMVNVRGLPEPEKTRFAAGTTAVLPDVAVKVSEELSESVTKTGMDIGVLSPVV